MIPVTSHQSPVYRPDIDGLRAIAILMVIAFHCTNSHHGFVGVDIFLLFQGI